MNKPFNITRRNILKSGGAMIVGFSIARPLRAQTPARGDVAGPPDAQQIDTWLAIHADNTATLYIGFVELGQGCTTALPQIAAEELDMDVSAIKTVQHDTNITPNQGGTYSSQAIQRGGPEVRQAAAEARQSLLAMASKVLEAPASTLTVEKGVVSAPNSKSVTYGELVGDRLFNVAFTGTAPLKSPDDYTIVGTPLPRKDLAAKAKGTYTYIQHLTLDGMLHGRIVRPRGQLGCDAGAKIISVDERSIADISGAKLHRKGDFLGVTAKTEWNAIKAARQLRVTWDDTPSLPAFDKLYASMRAEETEDNVIQNDGNFADAYAAAPTKSAITCHAPYQSHGTFAPNCALADVKEDGALVICSSQDIYGARNGLAALLGLPPENVRVQYAESSGTYGHSCWDDAAQSAALLSQLAGAPVRLQFMRWDEHGWDYYGPAHVGEARAAADENGRLTAYEYQGWAHHWSWTETTTHLATGAPYADWPIPVSQEVNPIACGGMYAVDNRHLLNHRVPPGRYLRAGWLRSPLDLSFAFTSEQAIDDLAYQLGMDALEFRLKNMVDDRWAGVLKAVTKAANWQTRPVASNVSDDDIVTGRGIGLGSHLASRGSAVAEIEVNRRTGKVRATHLYGAIDAGLAVNPGNVEAQIMGQLVQTASRMFLEEVTFNEKGVTSLDWNSYPVLRFEDCPEVTALVVQHLNEPSTGAGEEAMAATAGAIANAFFDATGVRMTQFPFTPERVLEALSKA